MDANQALAERFEEHRIRLRAVAYRLLGSLSEADDAVQEAGRRDAVLACNTHPLPERVGRRFLLTAPPPSLSRRSMPRAGAQSRHAPPGSPSHHQGGNRCVHATTRPPQAPPSHGRWRDRSRRCLPR